MASSPYEFSSNEEIDAWVAKDRMIEMTGYVDSIIGIKDVRTAQKKIFKFDLNNTFGRRVRVLIWGAEMAMKYQSQIQLNMVVELTGGTLSEISPQWRNAKDTIIPLEFNVQPSSEIIFHGLYENDDSKIAPSTYSAVAFEDVLDSEGYVEMQAYVKIPPVQISTGNSSFGQGMITDGTHRLIVCVASFLNNPRLQKGVNITLRGCMSKPPNQVCFKVNTMDDIDINEDVLPLSIGDLKKAIHPLQSNKANKRHSSGSVSTGVKRMMLTTDENNDKENFGH